MGFLSLRPLHVSSAYLGIITAGLGFVTLIIAKMKTTRFGTFLQYLHFSLWIIALIGIFYSYFTGDFGGREYWEFNPVWAFTYFSIFYYFLSFLSASSWFFCKMARLLLDVAHWNCLLYFHFYRKLFVDFSLFQRTFHCLI